MEKFLFLAIVAIAAWYWLKPKRKARPAIDQTEARAILGVAPDAGADDIRAAHRRLVSAVHPDRGGSAELTRRINIARDVLLARAVD
jgi:preprotein translocase subunit Sec63